jgi:hypothetical protein
VTHETSRYPPLIVLANHVINQLDHYPDSNICFCRNDPVLVGGSRAERKPDVAGVRYQSLEVLERSSVDNLMKDGLNGACFRWTELLLFFEFKTVVRGPGSGCSDKRSQLEYALSLGFLILHY